MLRSVKLIKIPVNVTEDDINNGKCGLAMQCMEKVAIARTLMNPPYNGKSDAELRVRVDAGHIKFNFRGWHWIADTPKIARKSLIDFDANRPVKPHSYTLTARQVNKITSVSPTRQKQINAARIERIKAGQPDKTRNRYTLRKRVVGFA